MSKIELGKNVTSDDVRRALEVLKECRKTVERAEAEAIEVGAASLRDTVAYKEAEGNIKRVCSDLGIPVPPFFDEVKYSTYH
jgi:hypothetical protein